MRLDPNPLFRRVITPWYDSELACWIVMLVMVVVVVFSCIGIFVSRQYPGFNAYTWVPVLLLILSLWVLVSVAYRLIQRYYERYVQSKDSD
jgi:hypothetical protein